MWQHFALYPSERHCKGFCFQDGPCLEVDDGALGAAGGQQLVANQKGPHNGCIGGIGQQSGRLQGSQHEAPVARVLAGVAVAVVGRQYDRTAHIHPIGQRRIALRRRAAIEVEIPGAALRLANSPMRS